MTLDPSQVLLTNRVAIVTGAAAGIGEAIALAYAIEREGRRVVAGELDVRDTDAVRRFVDVVAQQFDHVDVLVNNAGGGFQAAFMDVNEKGQDALVRENFVSVTNFTRAVVPRMPDTGGSIINITSIEAHRAGPGYSIYSAMKAAVASLTKSLALELGDRLVRVNCIAPDVIPTPGVGLSQEVRTPLSVAGHPDDVAGAAVYLASDLSRFVTGTTIHVDGGNLAAGGWHRQPAGSFRG